MRGGIAFLGHPGVRTGLVVPEAVRWHLQLSDQSRSGTASQPYVIRLCLQASRPRLFARSCSSLESQTSLPVTLLELAVCGQSSWDFRSGHPGTPCACVLYTCGRAGQCAGVRVRVPVRVRVRWAVHGGAGKLSDRSTTAHEKWRVRQGSHAPEFVRSYSRPGDSGYSSSRAFHW